MDGMSVRSSSSIDLQKLLKMERGFCWMYRPPPQFKIKPPDVVYVKTGESLSLPCEALGTPSPAVIWFKVCLLYHVLPVVDVYVFAVFAVLKESTSLTQIPLSLLPFLSFLWHQEKVLLEESVNLQILPNELRISNLRQTDMGDYICSAKNQEGTVTATTRVIVAGPAAITGPPRNITKLEGDKTELVCITKALPSNVTHRWFQNGSEVGNISWMSSRVNIKKDGTLVINPVTAEDSGLFTCEVSNGIGNPDSASAFLSVEYPARVTYSPTIQFLPLGLSGVVRCYVQANPAFQFITWTKDRRPFDPNAFPGVATLKNGSLFFQRVSQEHQGSYRCTPYNIHGTTGQSNSMEILVRGKKRENNIFFSIVHLSFCPLLCFCYMNVLFGENTRHECTVHSLAVLVDVYRCFHSWRCFPCCLIIHPNVHLSHLLHFTTVIFYRLMLFFQRGFSLSPFSFLFHFLELFPQYFVFLSLIQVEQRWRRWNEAKKSVTIPKESETGKSTNQKQPSKSQWRRKRTGDALTEIEVNSAKNMKQKEREKEGDRMSCLETEQNEWRENEQDYKDTRRLASWFLWLTTRLLSFLRLVVLLILPLDSIHFHSISSSPFFLPREDCLVRECHL